MSDFDENKFDREIRSLIDGVEEEVPDRVWDALSERLGRTVAAPKRKPVLPWLRYGGIAAAAAAVALGIFFGVGETGQEPVTGNAVAVVEEAGHAGLRPAVKGSETSDDTDAPDDAVSPAISSHNAPATEAQNSSIEDRTGHYAAISDRMESAPETEPAASETKADTVAVIIEETPEAGQSGAQPDGTRVEEQIRRSAANGYMAQAWDDDFPEDDESSERIRTAITISGLASSNTGTSRSGSSGRRPMMSGAHPDRNASPISETGNSSNYGIPVSVGIGAKIIFTPRWSLGVGVNYTLLTRTFSGTYTAYAEDGTPDPTPYSKIRNSQSYIGIPVNAYFSIVKSKAVDFYAYAGGTIEKCVADRYRMGDAGSLIHTEKVQGFQFSANAGLGVEFIIADMLGIYIDPSLRYYFPDSRQPKSIRTVQPLTMGFEMGFRVRL